MKRSLWMAAPIALGGLLATSCDLLDENSQYIAPVAAEIVLLNVPADNLAQYGITVEPTVTVSVAIGRLTDGSATSSSPFSGEGVGDAVVQVVTPDGKTLDLAADADNPGFYSLTSQDAPDLTYQAGADYSVNMTFSGQSYWAKFTASEAITVTAPEDLSHHDPGTDLTVSWTPATDTAALSVFNSSGERVYDNVPRDLNSLYTFMTQSDVSSMVVPGASFEADQVYAIGVAGLVRSEVDETHFSTNLNHLVSNAVSGTAVMRVVYTSDVPPFEVPTE